METLEKVTISADSYRDLVACRTLLDMILFSKRGGGSGYYDLNVIEIALKLRRLYSDAIVVDYGAEEGDENAQ